MQKGHKERMERKNCYEDIKSCATYVPGMQRASRNRMPRACEYSWTGHVR